MQRVDVGFRIDCEGSDSELLACANYAQRDLTAIGNQDFLEHALAIVGQALRLRLSDADWQAMRLPYN